MDACRQISDSFRQDYADFWHALVFQDVDEVKRCAERMNAGGMTELFVGMITKKPYRPRKRPNGAEQQSFQDELPQVLAGLSGGNARLRMHVLCLPLCCVAFAAPRWSSNQQASLARQVTCMCCSGMHYFHIGQSCRSHIEHIIQTDFD